MEATESVTKTLAQIRPLSEEEQRQMMAQVAAQQGGQPQQVEASQPEAEPAAGDPAVSCADTLHSPVDRVLSLVWLAVVAFLPATLYAVAGV